MLLRILLCIVSISYATAMMNPILGQDQFLSPQQLRNVSLYFGDMVLTEQQRKSVIEGKTTFAAPVTDRPLWKNAIIPYEIDCSIENMPDAVDAVNAAMRQWARKTCIRFVKHTNEKFFLTFFRHTHCWGNVAQVAESHISVGPGCEYEHVMAHEIGHVIGYYHEQNRKDRDYWVRIHWENIGQFKSAFDIVKNTDSSIVNYDYASIMHYPWNAFSSNGKITMEPLHNTQRKQPYVEVSRDDVKVTSKIYNCPAVERRRREARKRYRIPKIFTEGECVDLYEFCPIWARAGYCSTRESVRLGCRLSCGAPECKGSKCLDKDKNCSKLAGDGQCSKNTTVAIQCQKSCNPLCKEGPKTEAPKTEAPTQAPTQGPVTKAPSKKGWPNRNFLGIGMYCKDRHSSCRQRAARGECTKSWSRKWMLATCQLSCPGARCDRRRKRPPGACSTPLGLSVDYNGYFTVPDSAFYSATQLEPGAGWHAAPSNARLYFEDDYQAKKVGGWCAGNDHPEYLQVDLQREHTITYIATQGRNMYYERISKFKIQYSSDGQTYQAYQENGKDKEFWGNCDHFTPVLNRFKGLRARYIRYIPIEFNYPCVRMEFYGC